MSALIYAKDIIATALNRADLTEPWSREQMADLILDALDGAGVEVVNPQDLDWGVCSETGEPHHVSLSLCSGCLEYDPD
jgi:hypothetical protein